MVRVGAVPVRLMLEFSLNEGLHSGSFLDASKLNSAGLKCGERSIFGTCSVCGQANPFLGVWVSLDGSRDSYAT